MIQPGTLFARDFLVERTLATGGMGSLFVVKQVSTGRKRALKLMHGDLVKDTKLRERFSQEAQVGSRIESSHIVEVISAGVDEVYDLPYLVMELLEGETLTSALRSDDVENLRPARILAQLHEALGAAHANGIVHRDIKPDNIFLAIKRGSAEREVKVLDFGIAKLLADANASRTSAMGTPLWMAPEQTESRARITTAADVWALGLVTFAVLARRLYWRSATQDASVQAVMREVLFEPLVPASTRVDELGGRRLPDGFDAWFARCVARDPSLRFQNATESFAALQPLLQAESTDKHVGLRTAWPQTQLNDGLIALPPAPPPHPRRRAVRTFVLAGVLVATLAGGIGLWAALSPPAAHKSAKTVSASEASSPPIAPVPSVGPSAPEPSATPSLPVIVTDPTVILQKAQTRLDGKELYAAPYSASRHRLRELVNVNGDEYGDLVAICTRQDKEHGPTLLLFLGSAAGLKTDAAFTLKDANYRNESWTSILPLGDLNNDGVKDVALGSTIFLGEKQGNLRTAGKVTKGRSSNSSWADLNGDKRDDLILHDYEGGSARYQLRSSSDQLEPEVQLVVPVRSSKNRLVASFGDLNGDDLADILVANHADTSKAVFVYYGKPVSGPSPTSSFSVNVDEFIPGSAEDDADVAYVGDANGDGLGDIAVGQGSQCRVRYSAAGGAAPAWGPLLPINCGLAEPGDFNGDGFADLAARTEALPEGIEVRHGSASGLSETPATIINGGSITSACSFFYFPGAGALL